MTVIQFTHAFEKRKKVIDKLVNKEICIELKIVAEEIPFWIHFITHSTHSIGFLLQKETISRIQKLLQRDFSVLEDLQSRALMFAGYDEDINFSLTFEDVIIIEGQLERFFEECHYFNDHQYREITEKYMNTLYSVMEKQAQEFDVMTKYMMKDVLREK